MFQLIYLSWASDTFDPFGPRGMQSILNTAQNFNSSKNITGMLIFRNQLFLQLLEGEQKDVMELFEKIKSDPRHKDIQVILSQEGDKKVFPNWSMAYSDLTGRELDIVNEIMPWDQVVEDFKNGKEVPNNKILSIFLRFKYDQAA